MGQESNQVQLGSERTHYPCAKPSPLQACLFQKGLLLLFSSLVGDLRATLSRRYSHKLRLTQNRVKTCQKKKEICAEKNFV